jgi:hypothetical protein
LRERWRLFYPHILSALWRKGLCLLHIAFAVLCQLCPIGKKNITKILNQWVWITVTSVCKLEHSFDCSGVLCLHCGIFDEGRISSVIPSVYFKYWFPHRCMFSLQQTLFHAVMWIPLESSCHS